MHNELSKGVEAHFPYDQYRPEQRRILNEAADAITDDVDVIVIDAPTGIGKSGINMTLAKWVGDAWYTTPQKQLREQLADDDNLYPMHIALRGRADYSCQVPLEEHPYYNAKYMSADEIAAYLNGNTDCSECPINRADPDVHNCGEFTSPEHDPTHLSNPTLSDHVDNSWCRYWEKKEDAMSADVAATTFAMLIYDAYLDETTKRWSAGEGQATIGGEEKQVSFSDRDLLIIDEAHALENQTASLHLSHTISKNSLSLKELDAFDIEEGYGGDLPFYGLHEAFEAKIYAKDAYIDEITDDEAMEIATELKKDINDRESHINRIQTQHDGSHPHYDELINLQSRLQDLRDSIEKLEGWYTDERAEWVVDCEESPAKFEFNPLDVGWFLHQQLWNRPGTVILSTATVPYQADTAKWLQRLGLDKGDNDFRKISAPSPFSERDRPIVFPNKIAGSLSRDGREEHEEDVVNVIRELSDRHAGQKGLIHTHSYAWAETLHDSLNDIAMLHPNDDCSAKEVVAKWQADDRDILLSPAMTEGVDLEGDMCRWQALAKVPYPSLSDERVRNLADKNDSWYDKMTAVDIVQSAGRAVRSADDRAVYYVLDSDFGSMRGHFPDWFEDAITTRAPVRYL